MFYEVMVLICYLKKYALAILYQVTPQENSKPLSLPSLGIERIMINAHYISPNWKRSQWISQTKSKLLISMFLNLEQTLTCEFLSCLSWPLSFLFRTLLHSRGQKVSKVGPAGGSTKEQGLMRPQKPQQTNDLHLMQIVHMRKRECVLQLAFNLYFQRQLERSK